MPSKEEMQKMRKNMLNSLREMKNDAYGGLTCCEFEAINVLINFIKMKYKEDENG